MQNIYIDPLRTQVAERRRTGTVVGNVLPASQRRRPDERPSAIVAALRRRAVRRRPTDGRPAAVRCRPVDGRSRRYDSLQAIGLICGSSMTKKDGRLSCKRSHKELCLFVGLCVFNRPTCQTECPIRTCDGSFHLYWRQLIAFLFLTVHSLTL